MKKVNLPARIRRNMLDKLAGTHYVAEHAPIIAHLKAVNKHALVGIQRADGVYTVLGPEHVYYSTPAGAEGEIALGDLLAILRKNAFRLGKTAEYEFVAINDTAAIWVMNIHVMNALWNTLLLLEGPWLLQNSA